MKFLFGLIPRIFSVSSNVTAPFSLAEKESVVVSDLSDRLRLKVLIVADSRRGDRVAKRLCVIILRRIRRKIVEEILVRGVFIGALGRSRHVDDQGAVPEVVGAVAADLLRKDARNDVGRTRRQVLGIIL